MKHDGDQDEDPIWSVYVAEWGWVGKKIHVHMLVGGTDHLSNHVIRKAWWAGASKVESYNPSRHAVEYSLKGVKHGLEPDISAKIHRKIWSYTQVRGHEPPAPTP